MVALKVASGFVLDFSTADGGGKDFRARRVRGHVRFGSRSEVAARSDQDRFAPQSRKSDGHRFVPGTYAALPLRRARGLTTG